MRLRSVLTFIFLASCFAIPARAQNPIVITCTLSVTPTSGTAPLTVNASGNCTTDGTLPVVFYQLNWGDGSPTENSNSGTHTYSSPGTYTVTLTGSDDAGNQGSASQNVTVNPQPPTCTLSVKPSKGQAPLNVTATGNCADPGTEFSTTLDWGDGSPTQSGSSGTHTYTKPGTFTVTVTAYSGQQQGSASQNV